MSAREPMAPLRRRAIPGMSPPAPTASPTTPPATNTSEASPAHASASPGGPGETPVRRAAADYAATRLVNFRLPVDLHDRYRRLVREVEDRHPRLRRPSLTDVIIGLLEEGPADVDQLAAVIRRKRAGETREDPSR